jgi:hypothetical protein
MVPDPVPTTDTGQFAESDVEVDALAHPTAHCPYSPRRGVLGDVAKVGE